MSECECPTPPGGRVICAADQTAICVVDAQGRVTTGCKDRPKTAATQQEFENWALEEVTGEFRAPDQFISPTDRLILHSGRYVRKDGARVTFRLPREGFRPNEFGSFGGAS